jgi:M6 family metalloprotease-like protein
MQNTKGATYMFEKIARTSCNSELSLRAKTLSLLAALCLLCAASQAAYARPAGSGIYTVRQSDGSSFQVVQKGDEHGHWTEARDTGAAVVRDQSGSWCFARETRSGLLASSGRRYSKTASAAGGFLKNYAAGTKTASTSHRWTPVSVSGDKKLLILRVTFPEDASFDETMSVSLDYHLNNIWDGELSVRQYFRDQSKGKLNLEPCDKNREIIEVPMTSADYNEGRHPDRLISTQNANQYVNEVAFVQAVLKKAQQLGGLQYGDYAKWDDTLQKYVITPRELVVYLLVAGFEEAISAPDARPAVWAHALNSYYDGGDDYRDYQVWVSGDIDGQSEDITLEKWALNGELSGSLKAPVPMPATGTMCHELGHEICGLPDLYDTSYFNGGLGFFSLMSYGLDGAAKAKRTAPGPLTSTPGAATTWAGPRPRNLPKPPAPSQ